MPQRAISRLHHVVLDCPDPGALASFYSARLGLPITCESDDWVVVAESDRHSGPAFQLAPDRRSSAIRPARSSGTPT